MLDHCGVFAKRVLSLFALVAIAPSAVVAQEAPIAVNARSRVPVQSQITGVQPQTGIVLWTTNEHVADAPIQLEYAYFKYSDVVTGETTGPESYDWSRLEKTLDEVARRKHQLVLRWHDVYVGDAEGGVPLAIRRLAGYQGIKAKSEGKLTAFADWSNVAYQKFVLEFFSQLTERYDRDSRIAFVQVGFGLWAEYHIYDGPMELGKTFPTKAYQREFVTHLSRKFAQTPWMISVDAAGDHAPFADDDALRAKPFGVFDDSFLHKTHKQENEPNWTVFGRDRWQQQPAGGEFSYFVPRDQKLALGRAGPHGTPFEEAAKAFHISFMIGDGQADHQPMKRIESAGMATGYRFRLQSCEWDGATLRLKMTNVGVAPIYHDAYIAVNGKRVGGTLKCLVPGQLLQVETPWTDDSSPKLTIESDRLVPGQRIEFEAGTDRN